MAWRRFRAVFWVRAVGLQLVWLSSSGGYDALWTSGEQQFRPPATILLRCWIRWNRFPCWIWLPVSAGCASCALSWVWRLLSLSSQCWTRDLDCWPGHCSLLCRFRGSWPSGSHYSRLLPIWGHFRRTGLQLLALYLPPLFWAQRCVVWRESAIWVSTVIQVHSWGNSAWHCLRLPFPLSWWRDSFWTIVWGLGWTAWALLHGSGSELQVFEMPPRYPSGGYPRCCHFSIPTVLCQLRWLFHWWPILPSSHRTGHCLVVLFTRSCQTAPL